jgi:phosphoribosylformylglycinamidine synthase
MKFKAEIDVMPLKALLDPQGKAVSSSMSKIGLSQISDVRIGKHMSLIVDAANEEQAKSLIDKACKDMLCNQIMEEYHFTISEI